MEVIGRIMQARIVDLVKYLQQIDLYKIVLSFILSWNTLFGKALHMYEVLCLFLVHFSSVLCILLPQASLVSMK